MIRSRVTDGLSLAASAKTAMAENAAAGNPFVSGWTAPSPTDNVTSVAIAPATGEITITYTAKIDAAANTLVLAPRDGGTAGAALAGTATASTPPTTGSITWNCLSAASPAGKSGTKGTLPGKYAPGDCRN